MAKSKSKSKEKEVDWAKIGKLSKPLVDHITEPKQGIGTGKSIFDFSKPAKTGSMVGRNVILPQKPKLPVNPSTDMVDFDVDKGTDVGHQQDGFSDLPGTPQYDRLSID